MKTLKTLHLLILGGLTACSFTYTSGGASPAPNVQAQNGPTQVPTPVARTPVRGGARLVPTMRVKRTCGNTEVAPGITVRLDCAEYTPITNATEHMSVRKLQAFAQGTLRVPAKGMRRGTLRVPPSVRPTPPTPTPPTPTPPTPTPPTPPAPTGPSALPEAVDLRDIGFTGPVMAQGAVGACTAFAVSSVVNNGLRRIARDESISPTHVWAGYGLPSMREAGDKTIGRSLATISTLPYREVDACKLARDEDFEDCDRTLGVANNSWRSDASLVAALAKADRSGVVKVANFERLAYPPNLDEMRMVIANGLEIMVAIRIGDSSLSNRRMTDAVIADWSGYNGAHAVTLAGYRTVRGKTQFLIHNSWGTDWGDRGYAWISEEMVRKYMYFAYRIRLEGDPTSALVDEDCPSDQVIDSVTEMCAPLCSNSTRPANGQCK